MKYLFVLLFPLCCFAQTKGDTKIIITPTDSVNVFNRFVSYLYEQGYSLERKDDGFLLTDEREMKKYAAFYRVRALVKDGKITVTSSLRVPPEKSFTDVWWTKGNSWNKITWDIVDKLAKGFGAVIYSN